MKSANEDFCKSEFDDYLRKVAPVTAIQWQDVPQRKEPPDYYLSYDGIEYAVEVTTLMETIPVGMLSLPHAAVVQSLWGFVDEVEETAKRGGYLHGMYVVGFLQPIENFSVVREQIQAALLAYIAATQGLERAPEEEVFRHGPQRCSIQKVGNSRDKIEKAGPTDIKWEGEAAIQICSLLEERLADKCHKLRNIPNPKILLLYDSYRFADESLYKDCVARLADLAHFHTVFIVRGNAGNFVLHSHDGVWL